MVPIKAFTSKPTELRKEIDFELDGTEYQFNPPKTTSQLVTMMQIKGKDTNADLQRAGAMMVWLSNGLNREHEPNSRKQASGHDSFVEGCQSCDLEARLQDPDDGLELETVLDLIAWLMEQVSGRPTT